MRAGLTYSYDWWNHPLQPGFVLPHLTYSRVNEMVQDYRAQLVKPIPDVMFSTLLIIIYFADFGLGDRRILL